MKVKGKTIKYIWEILKEKGTDFFRIYEKLSQKHRKLIPPYPEKIEDEDLFPFSLYMEILEKACEIKGKKFARIVGKRAAELFLSREMRIAKRIQDIEWLISKDFLIADSFYGGGRYITKRISEREIKIKFENLNEINEFAEEKISGFLEGLLEASGVKPKASILSSPRRGNPFVEVLIKW